MNIKKIFFVVFLFTVTPAFGASLKSVVGTWRLISMERQNDVGQWKPRCHSPTGLITYTAQGFMAVGINCMQSEGSKEPSSDLQDMIFYTGKYTLDNEKITHHVMNSVGLDFFEKDLVRDIKFNPDGKISLSGKGKNGKMVRLLWESAK
ncbi:MAG: lipocalin-like domain-containing protein [Oligoflexia bacterium]